MAIDQYDHEMHPRCPPLGGEVPFYHCRRVNRSLPCHRVVATRGPGGFSSGLAWKRYLLSLEGRATPTARRSRGTP